MFKISNDKGAQDLFEIGKERPEPFKLITKNKAYRILLGLQILP